MAFPDTLLSNQWGNDTDAPTFIAPSTMNARVDQQLNALATRFNKLGGWLYGEVEGTIGNSVTIASASTSYIPPVGTVTFTLPIQRRVRIAVRARLQASTVPAVFQIFPSYVAGSTATTTGAVLLGMSLSNTIVLTVAAGNGAMAPHGEHSVLLAAGTYTAFPIVQRISGGSATDAAIAGYCAVYDAGNA